VFRVQNITQEISNHILCYCSGTKPLQSLGNVDFMFYYVVLSLCHLLPTTRGHVDLGLCPYLERLLITCSQSSSVTEVMRHVIDEPFSFQCI